MAVTNEDLKLLIDSLHTLFNKHFVGGFYNYIAPTDAFVRTQNTSYFVNYPSPTTQDLKLTGEVVGLSFRLYWEDHRNEIVGRTVKVELLDASNNVLSTKTTAASDGLEYTVGFALPADLNTGITSRDVRKLRATAVGHGVIFCGDVNGVSHKDIKGSEFVDQVIPDLIIEDLEAIKTQTDRLPTKSLNGVVSGDVAKESAQISGGFTANDRTLAASVKVQTDRLPIKTVNDVVSGDVAQESTQVTGGFNISDRTLAAGVKAQTDRLPIKTIDGTVTSDVAKLSIQDERIANFSSTTTAFSFNGGSTVGNYNSPVLQNLDIVDDVVNLRFELTWNVSQQVLGHPLKIELIDFNNTVVASQTRSPELLGYGVFNFNFSVKQPVKYLRASAVTTVTNPKINVNGTESNITLSITGVTSSSISDRIISIKTQTDKIPSTITNINSIKTQTDKVPLIREQVNKIPTVLTQTDKIPTIITQTDKIPTILTQTDKIPTVLTNQTNIAANVNSNKGNISLIKTQTDKIPATIVKVDAIKVQTDRLPTKTVNEVVSGNVAIEIEPDETFNIPTGSFNFIDNGNIGSYAYGTQAVNIDRFVTGFTIKFNWSPAVALTDNFNLLLLDKDFNILETKSMVVNTTFFGDSFNGTTITFKPQPIRYVRFERISGTSRINTGGNANVLTLTGVYAPTHDQLVSGIIVVQKETDKIPATIVKIDAIKTETDKVPATIVKVDAIKVQTDRLPTKTVGTVVSGDVAKETDTSLIKTAIDANHLLDGLIKTQTDKIPATIVKIDSIKTETDKVPATIVKVDAIKVQTDKIPTVLTNQGTLSTSIGSNKTAIDLIKTQTDKVPATIVKVDAIKVQTDRLPTKTVNTVVSGDVAKETDTSGIATTTTNIKTQTDKIPAIKTETDKVPATIVKIDSIKTETDKVPATIVKVDAIKVQTDRLPTKTVNDVVSGDVAKETDTSGIATTTTNIKTQTDKIPATIVKVDTIKVQTDRLPTKTVGTVVSGDVAKETDAALLKITTDSILDDTDTLEQGQEQIKTDFITLFNKVSKVETDVLKVQTQTDRLPVSVSSTGVISGDVAKESTQGVIVDFNFTSPTDQFVYIVDGDNHGHFDSPVTQELQLTNIVKEITLKMVWVNAIGFLADKELRIDLLGDDSTVLATKNIISTSTGYPDAKFNLPTDLKSGITNREVRYLKVTTIIGTKIFVGAEEDLTLTITGIEQVFNAIPDSLIQNINNIKTQTDRLPIKTVNDVVSGDVAKESLQTEHGYNATDRTLAAGVKTQTDKIPTLITNQGTLSTSVSSNKTAIDLIKTQTDKVPATIEKIDSIKQNASAIKVDTTAIKVQNVAINSDVNAVKNTNETIKANVATVDTKVGDIQTQTDKIPSVKTETDKIPATIIKVDAIKVQTDRLPTKTVGTVVSGDVAKESTGVTLPPIVATDLAAIKTQTDKIPSIKSDTSNINVRIPAIESDTDQISGIVLQTNKIQSIKTTVEKVPTNSDGTTNVALETKQLTDAQKAKIQGLPSDLGNAIIAIKADTTILKSDADNIIIDTDVIKTQGAIINTNVNTGLVNDASISNDLDNVLLETGLLIDRRLSTAQLAKIDSIPLTLSADIAAIEASIEEVKVEVDKITAVETKIDALKVQLTNKETGLSTQDKADLIAAIVLTEQYDYQQTNTEFIVTDSTDNDAVIARFTINKDGDGNVTRRQLQ